VAVAPGTRLGAYEIVSLLGTGGMGEVYRARDLQLSRNVALKILPEVFATDPERLARFGREAQVLAALNHPNIAQIYAIETSGSTRALVMELVEGQTLAERIAKGPIPIDEALPIAKQIAEALEAAHEQGIIHRDLKPANIKVRNDGTVKVLDFGLAKLAEPVATSAAQSLSPITQSPTITSPAMMTGIGVILGTAAYMSPEQAKGRPADKRSDIWAFGCVLYEMLTGKRAFQGEDVADTLAAALRASPDWSDLPVDVPAEVRDLLVGCLEKDRKKRIGDIAVARFAFDRASAGPRIGMPGRSSSRTRLSSVAVVASLISTVAAAALIGVFIGTRRTSSPSSEVTRFALPLPEGQRFTGGTRRSIDITRDGKQIVYVANGELYLRTMADATPKPLTATHVPGGIFDLAFSPDGQAVVFYAPGDQTLKRVGTSGGPAVSIASWSFPAGLAWATDGILIGGRTIARASQNGGAPETLIRLGPDEAAFRPQMLPGGRAVIFTLMNAATFDANNTRIVVQLLASNERKIIADGGSDARYVRTGHVVYAVGGVLFARRFDVDRLEPAGPALPVLEGVQRGVGNAGTGTAQYAVADNGTLIFLRGPGSGSTSDRRIVYITREGVTTPLKLPTGFYESVRVSPDGTRLAVVANTRDQTHVFVYDLSGVAPMRQLTFEGRNRNPIWSPDGERIVFQSDRGGDQGIWWQRADGTGVAERLTTAGKNAMHVPESFSPAGERFSFSIAEGTLPSAVNPLFAADTVTLSTFSLADRRVVPFGDVRSTSLLNSEFSPDGKWIAYTVRGTREVRGASVFVEPVPPTGQKSLVSGSNGHHPLWSRDGKRLLYFPGAEPLLSVPVIIRAGFAVGEPEQVPGALISNTSVQSGRNHDLTADGRIIAVVQAGTTPDIALPQAIEVVLNWFEELKARVPTK
jgi:serine/threonine-protein kinase